MRQLLYVLTAALLMFSFAALEQCSEDDVVISREQVPAKVLETLVAKFPDVVVDEYIREDEEGEVHYAFAFIYEGLPSEATFNPQGRLLELEQEIPLEQIPSVIQDSLRSRFGPAILLEAEHVFAGSDSYYEITFRQKLKDETEEREARFGEDGQFILLED